MSSRTIELVSKGVEIHKKVANLSLDFKPKSRCEKASAKRKDTLMSVYVEDDVQSTEDLGRKSG